MKKKLTVEIAEGLGNQIFMYAFAYSLSKKFGYNLYIDNKSGYYKKKNLLRNHQKYMLDYFNLEGNIATDKMIYNTSFKRLKKKLKLALDYFNFKKNFLIEKNKKTLNNKIAETFINIDQNKISNNLYIQGNFENYKYFQDFKSELRKIFVPKIDTINTNNSLINKIKNVNSISIHIRRNRFSDQSNLQSSETKNKSDILSNDIINYVNKSIDFINLKVSKPEYFIWSNYHDNIETLLQNLKIKNYTLVKQNDVINDFYLFKYCKHFIIGPSSFHWWGAWLNENPDKICIRPKNLNPSNNKNFWPEEWTAI